MELIDLSVITDTEKKLEEHYATFPLTLKYKMAPSIWIPLQQKGILLHVKYLLAEGVNSRIYLYSLYTKDDVKFSEANAKVFYMWDKQNSLWKQYNKAEFQTTYAKNFIEKLYFSICSLITKNQIEIPIFNQKIVYTGRELKQALLKMMHHSTRNSNIKEIIHRYVEYLIDVDFVPPNSQKLLTLKINKLTI